LKSVAKYVVNFLGNPTDKLLSYLLMVTNLKIRSGI